MMVVSIQFGILIESNKKISSKVERKRIIFSQIDQTPYMKKKNKNKIKEGSLGTIIR